MRVVCLIVVLAMTAFLFFRRSPSKAPGISQEEARAETGGNREVDAENPKGGVRLIDQSHFLQNYGSASGSIDDDLRLLLDLLRDCQLVMKDFDRYHLPGNVEIVRFLQGNNRDRLAWLPADFSYLGEDGALQDRLGGKVFFHRESGTRFSLRSAGPDLTLWTDDDVVVP